VKTIPAWVPLILAVIALAIGYGGLVLPEQHALHEAELMLAGRRAAAEELTAAIRAANQVPDVPQPATQRMIDRLWPDLVHEALALGYRFDLATFTDGPPLIGRLADGSSPHTQGTASPAVRSLEITVILLGPYLQLDEAVRMMQRVLPLSVWRAVRISTAEGARGAHITLVSLVPVAPGVV
jgi:hypothetical protein